jgi:hypothetical protein
MWINLLESAEEALVTHQSNVQIYGKWTGEEEDS